MLQPKHIRLGKEVSLLPCTFPMESCLDALLTAILPSNAFGASLFVGCGPLSGSEPGCWSDNRKFLGMFVDHG